MAETCRFFGQDGKCNYGTIAGPAVAIQLQILKQVDYEGFDVDEQTRRYQKESRLVPSGTNVLPPYSTDDPTCSFVGERKVRRKKVVVFQAGEGEVACNRYLPETTPEQDAKPLTVSELARLVPDLPGI